jgi:aspartyl-tRNA(Asn)/glutamyl-tRNA(Gln) amidotransferase subunit C
MKTELNTIKYVADLAAIQLSEAETEGFAKDLGAIVSYMEQLMAIDTSDIKPMEHVLSIRNAFREDTTTNADQKASLLEVAPKTEDGYYLVPNVVE